MLVAALALVAVLLALRPWLDDPSAAGPAWRVDRVHDGDTVTGIDAAGRAHRIRLVGIDAPELDQPYGRAAQAALARKVVGRPVRVREAGIDQHGRLLGTLLVDGRDVNRELVAEGWAWVYAGFAPPDELRAAEAVARRGGLGLWADPRPQPPRQWRQLHPAHR